MITVRMTKKRQKQALLLYAGHIAGIHAELTEGGIDIKKPYTRTLERETGDSIYSQKPAPVKAVIQKVKKELALVEKKPVDDGIRGKTNETAKKSKKK